MVLGRSEGPEPVFGVWRMALALAMAAFLGGALGLIWQSAGFDDDEGQEEAVEEVEPVDPPSP